MRRGLARRLKKSSAIPLDDHIKSAGLSSLDFHPSVWSLGSWRGQQFGVPIYCTIELLAARSDLFEKDKIGISDDLREDDGRRQTFSYAR